MLTLTFRSYFLDLESLLGSGSIMRCDVIYRCVEVNLDLWELLEMMMMMMMMIWIEIDSGLEDGRLR
jgi:hypothetical protein